MEILDLTGDKAKSRAYLLEGQGLGLAFSATETDLNALVLQADVSYLYQLNLYTGNEETIDISTPPIRIGSLADGDFYITHDAPFGLITFLNPLTGETIEASGFATLNLTREIPLIDVVEE